LLDERLLKQGQWIEKQISANYRYNKISQISAKYIYVDGLWIKRLLDVPTLAKVQIPKLVVAKSGES
jgi:hypothetical protein